MAWAKAPYFVWACDQDVYVGGVAQSTYPGTLSFPIFETLPISQGSLRPSEKISYVPSWGLHLLTSEHGAGKGQGEGGNTRGQLGSSRSLANGPAQEVPLGQMANRTAHSL